MRPVGRAVALRLGVLLVSSLLAFASFQASAQGKASSTPSTSSETKASPSTGASKSEAASSKAASRPLWRELSAKQQKALAPLAQLWNGLTEQHKRKWLAVSRNFSEMPEDDQAVLHSRMNEWAGLSVQERAQARHNFAEVKRIPADERKAKWEAYQALSDEQKRELAARSSARPPGATATIQPTPAAKLAPLPAYAEGHTPRIQLAPPPATGTSGTFGRAPVAPASVPFPPVSAEAQVPPPSGPSAPAQAESQEPQAASARAAADSRPSAP
ncbi:conserved exported hypothetical protein [Burkholderiales bacterium 8X]|nr:conserved exported hypothetical protein [Burkholderiales bacterium 8X]